MRERRYLLGGVGECQFGMLGTSQIWWRAVLNGLPFNGQNTSQVLPKKNKKQKKAVQVRFQIIARTKPEVAGRSKNSNLKYGWAWIGL